MPAELIQGLGAQRVAVVSARPAEWVPDTGVETALPEGIETAELIRLMRRDKKALTGLAFVLDGLGGAELVHDVSEQVVAEVLERMPRQPLGQLTEAAGFHGTGAPPV
ncbi:hypothetical protein [Streptomyces zaehneri]|uniref:hypothetical protein n=1 Tax=Streptomyces zaehneri TaxID=3051180 RepID=UPI0028D23AD1|nr:hypothetical protein [Streptomyces sp. DSM 40713]